MIKIKKNKQDYKKLKHTMVGLDKVLTYMQKKAQYQV